MTEGRRVDTDPKPDAQPVVATLLTGSSSTGYGEVAMHWEYDLPPRGMVETEDLGWIDWRKAKRLRRKGKLVPARPWPERAKEAFERWRQRVSTPMDPSG